MKDSKGHGSNKGGYAAATAALASAHQSGVATVPTADQFNQFRAGRRETVGRIASTIKSGTIPKSPWALGVISRARAEHTASIKRQRGG